MILVVDDNAPIRETLREILEEAGYRVRTASHGAEALRVLLDEPGCQLILTDLCMPVMDGAVFRRELLRQPELARIPVVVMSSVAETDPRVLSMKAAAVMSKPICIPRLLRLVDALRLRDFSRLTARRIGGRTALPSLALV